MKLQLVVLGKAPQIGNSCLLVRIENVCCFLLDVGGFTSQKSDDVLVVDKLKQMSLLDQVQFAVLSHSHGDHSKQVTELLALNNIKLFGIGSLKQNVPLIKQKVNHQKETMIRLLSYFETVQVSENVRLTLFPNGHLNDSCSVFAEIEGVGRILFSSDYTLHPSQEKGIRLPRAPVDILISEASFIAFSEAEQTHQEVQSVQRRLLFKNHLIMSSSAQEYANFSRRQQLSVSNLRLQGFGFVPASKLHKLYMASGEQLPGMCAQQLSQGACSSLRHPGILPPSTLVEVVQAVDCPCMSPFEALIGGFNSNLKSNQAEFQFAVQQKMHATCRDVLRYQRAINPKVTILNHGVATSDMLKLADGLQNTHVIFKLIEVGPAAVKRNKVWRLKLDKSMEEVIAALLKTGIVLDKVKGETVCYQCGRALLYAHSEKSVIICIKGTLAEFMTLATQVDPSCKRVFNKM